MSEVQNNTAAAHMHVSNIDNVLQFFPLLLKLVAWNGVK